MAEKGALARLRKEFIRIQKEPVEGVEAAPCETNLLEWHYVVTGPRGSPYEGGRYHGKLIFPAAYPYKPPSIMMITPSGRFKTNTRLCLSMSDFHPETWNPLWSVSSILSGLLSFMLENARTYGSIDSDDETRRKMAAESLAFNVRDVQFNALFPHYRQQLEQQARAIEEKKAAAAASSSSSSRASINETNGAGVGGSGEEKAPLAAPAAAMANGGYGNMAPNQHVKQDAAARNADLLDKLILLILVLVFFFALSYLYT